MLLVALGTVIGVVAAAVVYVVGRLTSVLHAVLFGLPYDAHLSAQEALASPYMAVVPVVGGAILGGSIILARRFRTRPPVDPIEANAVHGGLMSFRESLIVTSQTVISSGFGASVGLEAGFTQLSSAIGSWLGSRLRLRRNEIRLLVGCGAAGAIAAAFGAPITGAFYAFELIIGVYSAGTLAPVLAAALSASFFAQQLGVLQAPISLGTVPALAARDIVPFMALGVVCALVSIAMMLMVAWIEQGLSRLKLQQPLRPAIGGIAVGLLALATPAVLSTGHGALVVQLAAQASLASVALVFALKFLASCISLGAGFRGGLFFASLLMGAMLGKFYGLALAQTGLAPDIDVLLASVVGMASLAAGVVGGPLTMAFLVLEMTRDLAISAAVMVAAGLAALLVRELFGFSFSTWRLHLRGENVRSAHDVGRLRNLTVQRMMRADIRTVTERTTIGEFRLLFPLGSTERVVVTDTSGRYAGIVVVADAFQPRPEGESPQQTISPLLRYRDNFLLPGLNAADAAATFKRVGSEELAVVDNLGNRNVVGLLTEAHLLRRYAEELDKGLKDLTG
ncbi:chloride channel protein [Devosia sp.]|uniref:chloride channel protein n=1 Tax=Devosia sp. TaxID=1871048 RepID=UPI0025C1E6A4|nr:chloride channel protein [Devosia sp.]